MSDLYKRIDSICKENGTNVTALCKKAGVGRATLSELNAGRTKTLNADTVTKLAAALGVSVDYLLGAEAKEAPALTEKDRRDVAKDVYQIMQSLESSGELMFDGVPMSEESKAAMAAAMKVGLEEARRRNKATYTPKKFRRE